MNSNVQSVNIEKSESDLQLIVLQALIEILLEQDQQVIVMNVLQDSTAHSVL